MDRKPIFDSVRAMLKRGFTELEVAALDLAIDRALGIGPAAITTVSAEGIALMHHFEKCELKAYPDPGSRDGKPVTIGWGSTTDENGRPITLGTVWTRERADARYKQDLDKFSIGVANLIDGTPTTQNQFDALVSLAYNIGLGNFAKSTLLRRLRAGDYVGAAEQFRVWRFNDGVEMRGLLRRRVVETAHYREQDWRAADVAICKELGI